MMRAGPRVVTHAGPLYSVDATLAKAIAALTGSQNNNGSR